MQIRFLDRGNRDVDELVRIAWESRGSHEGEYLMIPERSETEVSGFIKDEDEGIPEDPSQQEDVSSDFPEFEDIDPQESGPSKDLRAQRLLIAVDSGVVDLGEFVGGGVAFAIRGAAVCLIDNDVTILKYNTGALFLDEENKVPVFRYMGLRMGKDDLYLVRNEEGELLPRPSAFETGNQLRDRCRNFVERMIQEEVLGILAGNQRGLLLLDGALPAGTFDTPQAYLRSMGLGLPRFHGLFAFKPQHLLSV